MRRYSFLTLVIATAILLNACSSGISSFEPTSTPASTTILPPTQSNEQPVTVLADNVRTFHLVPQQSEVSYKAQEKFLERPLPNKAIRTTNQVEGRSSSAPTANPPGGF